MSVRRVRYNRSQTGGALAEGAAAIALLTGLVVAGVIMIVSISLLMLYHLKVRDAAQVGANGLLTNSEWLGAPRSPVSPGVVDPTAQAAALDATNKSLQLLGLPTVQRITAKVTVAQGGVKVYSVTVSESALPLIQGGILPDALGVTETATASTVGQSPIALAWLYFNPPNGIPGWPANAGSNSGGLLVPVYMQGKAPGPPWPSGSFPFYSVDVAGGISSRGQGNF